MHTPVDGEDSLQAPPTLGAALRAHRSEQRTTQSEAAAALGVSRATLAQWEADRHLPSPENARLLDDFYGAGGALVALADAARSGTEVEPATRPLSLAEVFSRVAEGLLKHLVRDPDGTPLGWRHSLGQTIGPHTASSTAFGIRTLLLLDEARAELPGIAARLAALADGETGWSYAGPSGSSRMRRTRVEGNAVVVDALVRVTDSYTADHAIGLLERSFDAYSRTRPYVLATVLETVLRLRPEAPFARSLVEDLLAARKSFDGTLLWPANTNPPADRVEPSVAHTARAAAVLKVTRSFVERSEVDDAIGQAVAWIANQDNGDSGVTETLQPDPDQPRFEVVIRHFTSAWVVRALAGADGVPGPRMKAALDALWSYYSPMDGLWMWKPDGYLPVWMTHDAVAALRGAALASFSTPLPASRENNDVPTVADAR